MTSRLILMSNLSLVLQVLFGLSISGIILPLCLLRLIHRLTIDGQISKPSSPTLLDSDKDKDKKKIVKIQADNCCTIFLRNWLRKFWLLANVDHLCFPLIAYTLFIAVGPWAIGYFLQDDIGVLFSWGMYINGMDYLQLFLVV